MTGEAPQERWPEIERLLDEVLELPSADRPAFLARACSGDVRLRAEVERLLRASEVAPVSFLEDAAAAYATPLLSLLAEGSAPAPGSRLGHYEIVRELGRGGMARVYLAHDLKHNRQVALKVLHGELAAMLGAERFLQEIRITAKLDHPHIVTLLDSGESDGVLWYALPYVHGESLRDRLTREQQLSVEEAVRIATQVASALDYAHGRGVIHRDIKPENILLHEGEAVVADLGIALAVQEAGGTRLTGSAITLGTPAYMSPEQATRGKKLDARTDEYSLGAVVYEMLAGEPPHTGPTPHAVIAKLLTEQPTRIRTVRDTVPEDIDSAVAKALAKTPADRYTTAGRFAEALDAALRRPSDARRRGRLRVAAGLAGAAALALGAAYLATRGPAGGLPASVSTIAVLPFVPVAPDTGLERLGRELVVTLSANLDGVGGIHTTEAITVLALVPEGEPLTLERGAELARHLGARSVLRGTLVPAGREVRLDLALFDLDSVAPLVHASVTAMAQDIAVLSDSATLAVLNQLWRRGKPPAPNLAAITTRSIPALRAYLEGEQALARAEMPDAIAAFERAFDADSHFWFAFWRSLYPRTFEGTPRADRATVRALIRHRSELPEVDRLMIEAKFVVPTMSGTLAVLRDVTRRFPNYWPAWYDYGNFLVHWTPYLGTTFADARAALERVVELNPKFVPAWEHLLWIAVDQRDTAGVARAVRALEGFSGATGFRMNPMWLNYYHAWKRVVDAGGQVGPEQLARDARYLVAARSAPADVFAGISVLWFGLPRAQLRLNDAVLALKPNREFQAVMWWGKGFSYAAVGAWDSGLVAMDRWQRLTGDSTAPLGAYGLGVAGVRLGALDAAGAALLRPIKTPTWREGRAELAWLDGILAYDRGDAAALDRARREVRESGCPYRDLLDRSLAAFGTELAGDRRAAAQDLAALEWEITEQQHHHFFGRHHPYLNSVNRLSASRWFIGLGDAARATRLLHWHEAHFWAAHWMLGPANQAYAAPALFDLARIEEATGDTAAALQHYREFLQRYDVARGGWAGVEQARGKVERLSHSQ